MIKKGKGIFDKTVWKKRPIRFLNRKSLPNTTKKCIVCGRRTKFHHHLCPSCHKKKWGKDEGF